MQAAEPRFIDDRGYLVKLADRQDLAPWVRGARLIGRLQGVGYLSDAEAGVTEAEMVAAVVARWSDLHPVDVSIVLGRSLRDGCVAAAADCWRRMEPLRLRRSDGFAAVVAKAGAAWPAEMPRRPAEAATMVQHLAEVLGVQAGLGALSLDDAYRIARRMCAAIGRVEDMMPRCAGAIDAWSVWAAEEHNLHLGRQFHVLFEKAKAGLLDGQGPQQVRAAMASTASQMVLPPPSDLLGEAFSAAVGAARKDRQWLATRKTA